MTPAQCDELERALARSSDRARSLFERNPPARLSARPGPQSWSAAECLVHLTLTSTAFAPRLDVALRELREAGRRNDGPSRMDWTGRMLNWSLEPRPWLKMKTTRGFQPLAVGPVLDVLPSFLERQQGLVTALRSAQGLDLAAAMVVSPFNERIRYNVYSAFCIIETHERRHLRQAEAAVASARRRPGEADLP